MKDYVKDQINNDLINIINDNVNYDVNNTRIKLVVIGVGGGGNNAVKMILEKDFKNVDFIVANTDDQSLAMNPCKTKINLGKETRGLGAGSDPELGAKSAYDSLTEIQQHVEGTDIVVVAAGFGGGTGTGAAPVIAEIAKKAGALTIGIVTTPFEYEGPKRNRIAKEGLKKLSTSVDSYIVISNDKLADNFSDLPVSDTFKLANITLKNIIVAFHDILYRIGDINIDFADVSRVLKNGGLAVVGIGQATGKERATKAVINAFEQNLYEFPVKSARRILVNIQYDKKTTLAEIKTAVKKVHEMLSRNLDENEEYDCIIGQEPIETKDNAGLFKVSIIAGDAQILSENEIKENKKTLLSNQKDKFEIIQEDVIKEQVIVYPTDEKSFVYNSVLENDKLLKDTDKNVKSNDNNDLKVAEKVKEELEDNSWIMDTSSTNDLDFDFNETNKNSKVNIALEKYDNKIKLNNSDYIENKSENNLEDNNDYNFKYDYEEDFETDFISFEEDEDNELFSGAEAGTYSDSVNNNEENNEISENQSQNESKENDDENAYDWFK